MHKLLSRQTKRLLGVDEGQLADVILELRQLGERGDPGGDLVLSPQAAGVLKGFASFLERVDGAYVQSDRDLDLRARSLEISSVELTQTNERIREELASRTRAIESLRDTANSLRHTISADAPLLTDDSLEALSKMMSDLVEQRELSQRKLQAALTDLANQKFALDQHAIVSITDESGTLVYANAKFCEISEYSLDELIGQHRNIIYAGDESTVDYAAIASFVESGNVWHGELCQRAKSGRLFWVNATMVPVTDQGTGKVFYISIRTDITEQKRMAASIQEAEIRLLRITNAVPGVVYRCEVGATATRYTFVSERLAEVRGLDRAALLADGSVSARQILPEDRDRCVQGVLNAAAKREPWRDEYRIVMADGSVRWIRGEIRPEPELAKDGATVFIGIWQDVSDSMRASEELRVAKEGAEAASRSKSEFLANMSHEIRTPMNGVIGMTELVLDTDLSALQRDYLGVVKSSSESLLAVINDILDFSKIEAGKMIIESVPFQLQPVIDETLKPLALRANEKGVGLVCDVAPGVPMALQGDPGRLRQVLVNLVGNAIKFTDKGEVAIRVRPMSAPPGAPSTPDTDSANIQFSISDSGIGISPARLDAIFDAFSQEDSSTTRKYGGTGLGLTISRRLVEALGGRIWVESEIGRGSTFHFSTRFLLDASRPADSVSGDLLALGATQPAPELYLDVLLVEDNLVNQKLATMVLKKWGHQVTLAENGQLALDALAQRKFDVILMDMMMPVMGGLEATEAFRRQESGRRTPIIAMTANAMRGDRERCLEAGMDAYISKPIKTDELKKLLQEFGQQGKAPPSAQASPLLPRFDYARSLKGVDQEVVEIIAEPFLAEWPQDWTRLQAALADSDLKGLLRIAHTLKGTLAMFGADPASELAARLERLADTPLADAAALALLSNLSMDLEREVSQLVVVLQTLVQGQAS